MAAYSSGGNGMNVDFLPTSASKSAGHPPRSSPMTTADPSKSTSRSPRQVHSATTSNMTAPIPRRPVTKVGKATSMWTQSSPSPLEPHSFHLPLRRGTHSTIHLPAQSSPSPPNSLSMGSSSSPSWQNGWARLQLGSHTSRKPVGEGTICFTGRRYSREAIREVLTLFSIN